MINLNEVNAKELAVALKEKEVTEVRFENKFMSGSHKLATVLLISYLGSRLALNVDDFTFKVDTDNEYFYYYLDEKSLRIVSSDISDYQYYEFLF